MFIYQREHSIISETACDYHWIQCFIVSWLLKCLYMNVRFIPYRIVYGSWNVCVTIFLRKIVINNLQTMNSEFVNKFLCFTVIKSSQSRGNILSSWLTQRQKLWRQGKEDMWRHNLVKHNWNIMIFYVLQRCSQCSENGFRTTTS